ncbi:pyridoxal phosphate-dependent aminotransferase [Sediminibacterium sp. TEGAF015]|uniref:pyridoxal phosphate-dependent aminotransferase n=1 Tax=Sediminibacterium sp. TEGAF015 TaxID=575378 RepID=UPI00220D87FC|nr:pyridoxal phosphate-dependent aminotransferase [Sediminibacterium sp. TEGAF015]BDQ12649.1 aspartate aminotransferase [Sediminibacterium sp. TEGAF015]
MSKLSHLAETLIGSEIVKLGNAINERIRNGETIYNFTIGDFNPSEFPIPVELEQLIIEAYQQKKTSYPAAEGILDLRKSISQFIQDWEGLHFTPAEIQVASGGRPLIYALFKVIVDKGDKVVYGVPSWNNNHYVHLTEGQHCEVSCLPENDFMPTVEDLKPHIKGASLICLCTPQNPTGTTLGKHALAEICELILEENARRGPEEKKLYLMFDQMYWTLTYGDTVHYNPLTLNPAMKPYTIFIDGISKVFSATGVRVGWALGPENVIAKMKAILSHLGAWAPMAEQHAVAKYLPMKEAISTYLTHFKSEIAFRLQNIYEGIIALKQKGFKVDAIAPQAAIYLTIQIDLVGSKTADGTVLATQSDVTQYILSEAKIAIVPFSAFGAGANSSWYRLSVGTCRKQDIPTVLAQLGAALEKLS